MVSFSVLLSPIPSWKYSKLNLTPRWLWLSLQAKPEAGQELLSAKSATLKWWLKPEFLPAYFGWRRSNTNQFRSFNLSKTGCWSTNDKTFCIFTAKMLPKFIGKKYFCTWVKHYKFKTTHRQGVNSHIYRSFLLKSSLNRQAVKMACSLFLEMKTVSSKWLTVLLCTLECPPKAPPR